MNTFTKNFLSVLCLSFIFLTAAWAEEGEEGATPTEAQYHNLTPPFVANYGAGNSKKLKFVKADISVRSSSPAAINEVMAHDALVRHQIVMLLSRQTEEELSNPMGQESIRLEALKMIQEVLKKETGDGQIEDLFFTNFVVQH